MTPVPESSTFALMGSVLPGLLGFVWVRWRRTNTGFLPVGGIGMVAIRTILFAVLFVVASVLSGTVLLGGSPAYADVIFSDFGPGNTFQTNVGNTICGTGTFNCAGNPTPLSGANSFTPTGSYTLSSISLATALVTGTNQLVVSLMPDAGGIPGTPVETWTFTNAMQLQPTILSASSVGSVVIDAGTQYWLAASAPGDGTWAVWFLNSIGLTGTQASRVGSGAWFATSGNTLAAFSLDGTPLAPIPEPSSLVLLTSGLAGLMAVVRRRPTRRASAQ